MWFRNDLRLADNPALQAAIASKRPLLCVYIHDDESPSLRPMGGAAKWWLHGALQTLGEALIEKGGALVFLRGAANKVLERLVEETNAAEVFWNRRYDQAGCAIDDLLKQKLTKRGIGVQTFNAILLYEPWAVMNKSDAPFRVFSAYRRAAASLGAPEAPLPAPHRLTAFTLSKAAQSQTIELGDLHLLPTRPDWARGLRETWISSETSAQNALARFVKKRFASYASQRDQPNEDPATRLSPYLHWGQLSPHQVWHCVKDPAVLKTSGASKEDLDKFLSELCWREFSHHLLFHFPEFPTKSFQPRFDTMSWRKDAAALRAWQRGNTGYPMVDAGMRQLWTTGWLPNRLRMIVASFLVKDLLIDWREGEAWFWDTLVDADAANNAVNWQWVAGSGVDAAPFFRIFNPVLQGEKFDANGDYVKQFVPELMRLPASLIHKPWKASEAQLKQAGVVLGKTYPLPIVEHDMARQRALEALKEVSA
jgi:deoxyribodipyrimidine photo-lyase